MEKETVLLKEKAALKDPGSYYFYANPYREKSIEAAENLKKALEKRGGKIYAPRWLCERLSGLEEREDVPSFCRAAIALGGDGTLLRLCPMAAEKKVPMLGVHTGRIGFLMHASPEKTDDIAFALAEGRYTVKSEPMLNISVMGKNYLALNDISITRGQHPGIMAVRVQVNGETVYTPHGDGVILSTPLGSTAYALAAGGPIVHPEVRVLLITPICAREMLSGCVVVPLDGRVTFTVPSLQRDEAQLSVDGQTIVPLPGGEQAEASLSPMTADMIQLGTTPFFETLRRKTALWNNLS